MDASVDSIDATVKSIVAFDAAVDASVDAVVDVIKETTAIDVDGFVGWCNGDVMVGANVPPHLPQ